MHINSSRLQETLNQQAKIRLEQDSLAKTNSELRERIAALEDRQTKVDELFIKFQDLNSQFQGLEVNTEKNISKIEMKFADMVQEFQKSEEISRISRRTSDDLKEEYCRVVFSVAAERKRNDLFIEATKREFEKDISDLNKKIATMDELDRRISELKELQMTSARDNLLKTETELREFRQFVETAVDELTTKSAANNDLVDRSVH